jgi:serine/threonine protein kinase
MNPKPESLINRIFFDRYKVIKKIGQGSFGRIYSCQDLVTNDFYAMKVEQNTLTSNVLLLESQTLSYLKGVGIPEVQYFGHTDNYHILIETLLDKSLENLYSESHGNFNLKDISMIGIQVLDRLEFIHSKNIIHRDIKPDNFVIGKDKNKNIIYMIDFGLAKKYRNPSTLQHIEFKITKRLTGTARYASVNALKGGEQSRRDDLESLAYMLLYFLRGSLPWMGIPGMTKGEKYKKIYYIKKNISVDKLFEDLPNEFKEYYSYVKLLEFEQEPDYEFCRKLFLNVIINKLGEVNDNFFTWCKEIKNFNKDILLDSNIFNKASQNPDESGRAQKSLNIINLYHSNIFLDKREKEKINNVSANNIHNENNKNEIQKKFTEYFSLDQKKNKSFLMDLMFSSDRGKGKKWEYEGTNEIKEIIVTTSTKKNKLNDDYSIEVEVDKKKKKKNISKEKKKKINILLLSKINKKKDIEYTNFNKMNKNLNRTKTNRDLLSKKKINFLLNNHFCNKLSRNRRRRNKSSESKSKSGNKKTHKNITNISYFFNKDGQNNSSGRINKTSNKLLSVISTHTNMYYKKKSKIKYLTKVNNISRINPKQSKNKMSLLLEDYLTNKNQCSTSRTNNIQNYLKKIKFYHNQNSKNKKKSISKDKYLISINSFETKKKTKSKNNSKNHAKSRNANPNPTQKMNCLTRKNSNINCMLNKQYKIQKLFSANRSKRNLIIHINKCYKKNEPNSKNQKTDTYMSQIMKKSNSKKKKNPEKKNNTINIESVVFIGDKKNTNLSKGKNNMNQKEKPVASPKNVNLYKKQGNKRSKNNFLRKFKIHLLSNNKTDLTNNNSRNKSNSNNKNKPRDKSYNHTSSKLPVKKKNKQNKKSNNLIFNYNSKKFGPISFSNLTNVRTKKNLNINNNLFGNNSIIDKKYFLQNSLNSSDNNYILNNINNNNIIVNNYSSNNSQITKKFLNSFSLNNKNMFPEEINEISENNNNNNNNNMANLGNNNNNNNSIFKDFIVKINKKAAKKESNNNPKQNIMKFLKKVQKKNIIKENIQNPKIKKK